jgi:hypothetical protein
MVPSSAEEMEMPSDILHTFFIAPRQCFRMLKSDTPRDAHCLEPVVWKGPWRDVTGEIWVVEACERHKPLHDVGREFAHSGRSQSAHAKYN